MKIDIEAIELELRKLDGDFVRSLRRSFDRFSNIRASIEKSGDLMHEKRGEVKTIGEKTLSALHDEIASVRKRHDAIGDADMAFLRKRRRDLNLPDEAEDDEENDEECADGTRDNGVN